MASMMAADVLMVVHSRPAYTARTLPRLLDVCSAEGGRVWVWRNGDDPEVAEIVAAHRNHPALHEVHHDPDNAALRVATNWMWSTSDGAFVGKVDDDCLVHPGWLTTLTRLHEMGSRFGALCAWHYAPGDFDEALAGPKIQEIDGVRLLRNLWTAGSGYLMRRSVVQDCGGIGDDESWHGFCVRASRRGWISGWPIPLVLQDHLDDPRVEGSGVTTDADLERYLPLSARSLGIATVDDWVRALQADARYVQTASLSPRAYGRFGRVLRRIGRRAGQRHGAADRKPIY